MITKNQSVEVDTDGRKIRAHVTQGVSTAQLSRELDRSYKQTLTLRQRLQDHANETAPLDLMQGTHFESDEDYQNVRGESDPHRDPNDPPRRRANKKPGHRTFTKDRPPIFEVISRETGEVHIWVTETADKETCQAMLTTLVPPGSILYRVS